MENDKPDLNWYPDRVFMALDYYFKTMELDSDFKDILFKASERFKVRPIDVQILLFGFDGYKIIGVKIPKCKGIFRYY